jgi:PEGA domain
MRTCRILAPPAVILMLVLSCNTGLMALSRSSIRIKVLASETHSVNIPGSDVPKNCDGVNYDAYCRNTRTVLITNTLLVQEGEGTPMRVACTVDTKWSRCVALSSGQSFDARREKRGITVYYVDQAGKARSQLYTLVASDGKAGTVPELSAEPNPEPPADPAQAPAYGNMTESSSRAVTVKCNFTSTPAGAEVTLDGQYVGSTPSIVTLNTGVHKVTITMPGFVEWKRDLNVSPESELTVNAVLQNAVTQKAQ